MTPIRWIVIVILCLGVIQNVQAETQPWKITAYCSCVKCCGKSDGITASGKQAEYGYVACNWLPFGTLVEIEDLGVFSVQDRGAKSLFGSKKNHIKHLDVYMPTHLEARQFGVMYKKVTVLK